MPPCGPAPTARPLWLCAAGVQDEESEPPGGYGVPEAAAKGALLALPRDEVARKLAQVR